uniref:Uncharacterized protein n=1 Tax=Ciona savignyi TaxID=51511 RepID=H2Z8E7_CIOSA
MMSTSGSSFVVATPLALIPPRPRDHFQAGQEHCEIFSNHLQKSRPPISGSFVKAKRLQLSALFSRNNKAVAPSTDNHLLNTVTKENETS